MLRSRRYGKCGVLTYCTGEPSLKVLLDENIDDKLKVLLSEPDIKCHTVKNFGHRGAKNGELLALAEGVYDVFVTMDKSIRKQQNLAGRRIALL